MKLKAGDSVKWKMKTCRGYTIHNKSYKVLNVNRNMVYFINDSGIHDSARDISFELDVDIPEVPEKAKRFNSGKVEGHTLPLLAVKEMYKAGMFGESKYDSNNWRKPTKSTQYYDCADRHLTKYLYGQELDSDSKVHHLAHVAWNCLAELEKILTDTRDDDRYVYDNVDEIIELVFNLSEGQKEAIERELKNKEK